MKNFRYKKQLIVGQSIKVLESLAGEPIECVREYVRVLFQNNAPLGTVETYTPCVCKYLDFAVEAMKLIEILPGAEDCKTSIVDIFFQAISFGCESELPIVRLLVERLEWEVLSSNSIKIHRAALFLFFQLSNKYSASSAVDLGEHYNNPDAGEKLEVLNSYLQECSVLDYKKSTWGNRRVNSYLSECIAGGIGVKSINSLPAYFLGVSSRNLGELQLSLADVEKLVHSARNLRDKVYYALLGAGGARVSETLQVLKSDIDEKRRKVYIVNPKTRKSLYKQMGLSMAQINSLRFKGRANQELTLIEPFASIFWDNLQKFLSSSEMPFFDAQGLYIEHDFLFCVSRGATKGMPLCLVDNSPVLRTLKKNLKRVGIQAGNQHDIRHMYVSHLCNDIPTADGFGIGVEQASKYVGHINIESTEVYNHVTSADALATAENFYIENGYYDDVLIGVVDER